MLLVKTKLGPSKIHGIGLFADQFIRKGTVVWQWDLYFDRYFGLADRLSASAITRAHLQKYAWRSKETGRICMCGDHGSFFNHSDTPNCWSGEPNEIVNGERVTKGLRDIKKGEELTDDYESFAA